MATHPPKDIQDVHHDSSPLDDAIKAAAGDHAEPCDHTSIQPLSTSAPIVQPEARGIAAQKVFGTGELLEETLSYLDPADILNAMIVQRHWRDSIEGSIKLKRLLGLAPGGNLFYSPFYGSSVEYNHNTASIVERPLKAARDFQHSYVGNRLRKDLTAYFPELDPTLFNVTFKFSAVARSDPVDYVESPEPLLQNPGSRIRDMAICTPPLKNVSVSLECWDCIYQIDRDSHDSYRPITSSSVRGVTIGDMADAALSLARTKHRKCPARYFYFGGSVDVEPEDPIVKSRIFEQAAMEAKNKYRNIVRVAFETEEERERKAERRAASSRWSPLVVDEDLKKRAAAVILPWTKPGKGPEMFEYEFNSDDEEGWGDCEEFMESESSEAEEYDEGGDAEKEPDDDDDAKEDVKEPEDQATEPRSEADDGDEDHDEEVHFAVGKPSVQHGSAHDEWDGLKQIETAKW
ncbi:unnamed protein product [Zymoseptoria tritici ST99CH_1E4]|uniref:F-box domain-containing protein n=1 Tax=Zymoseptoria tritici ST99CH_1E4 TaxID=1276532 RepID=A0A2H1GXH1_ZYMTR|nr:unnamed protein product [Zymoseptoria tritici ST99CH_1E4]